MAGRRVLFSAQKNEGPFILEWVAYHKVIGFTDVVVVSNDCDDGSDALLDALAAAGEVTHLRQTVPQGRSPQLSAERVARAAGVFLDGDWVLWLDLDEYLLPTSPLRTVDDLIGAIGPAEALFVAWRFFGDGGNPVWPGRHVSEDFILAARRWRGRRAQGKTMFRYGPAVRRLWIHRPLLADGIGRAEFPALTSAGGPIPYEFYDRRKKNPNIRMPDERRPYRLAQVAHFSVRTRDMFRKKAQRGDGFFANQFGVVDRNDRLFRRRNFCEVRERGLAAWAPETTAEMGRLLTQEAVRRSALAVEGFVAGPYLGA